MGEPVSHLCPKLEPSYPHPVFAKDTCFIQQVTASKASSQQSNLDSACCSEFSALEAEWASAADCSLH